MGWEILLGTMFGKCHLSQRGPGAGLMELIAWWVRQPGIELFNKYLLSTCSLPGSVLSDGDSEISKMAVLSDKGV